MTNRQEVAENLREVDTARTTNEVYVALLNCIGITHNYPTLFNRLADLIDPTCHSVTELEQDGIGAPHRYTTRCSNCGQLWSETSGAILEPKYCPHCGARVVRDE